MGKNRKQLKTVLVLLCVVLLGLVWFNRFQPVKLSSLKLPVLSKTDKDTTTDRGSNKTMIPAAEEKYAAENQTDGSVEDPVGDLVEDPGAERVTVIKKIVVTPTIDYSKVENSPVLKKLMDLRKEKLGIKKSLDIIVKSNESFKIDGVQVSMIDVLEKALVKKDKILKEKIDPSGAVLPQKIEEYGIYVVQPGDNIWNIHFNILKEFYEHKGITVSSMADEPMEKGISSGVGKILKFSETMVIIYNLVEKKVVSNIDTLEPLSKIIVYNMGEVFSLLTQVEYDNINQIQFDGQNIWIPAQEN